MSHTNPSDDRIRELLSTAQTIAVVGASNNPERPSHGIMKKLLDAGYRVVPVNPKESEVLGQKAYARLVDVPGPVDIVDVFVRAEATPEIAEAAVAIGAKALWLQLGIINEEAAARASAAGLIVVMDECIGVAHSRLRVAAKRRVARVETAPRPEPGFLGAGHTAVEVLTPHALDASDPFVLLMDDRIDVGPARREMGGAHPHAGLEMVTFVLDGTIFDRDEGRLSAGDVLWMSAGRGIIHSEQIEMQGKTRVLQLWVRLPARDRTSAPHFELVARDKALVHHEPDVTARLYSGRSGALVSPTKNHAAVTLIDVELGRNARFDVALPAEQTGFFYVIEGAVEAGPARSAVNAGQVGWLDGVRARGESALRLASLGERARVIIYAGEPQHEPLVHHGPFVAGSYDEIGQMFESFRRGEFPRLSDLSRAAGAM